jgi:hypothetical protein
MHLRFSLSLALFLVGGTVCCVHHAQQDGHPVAFDQLAGKFRAKAGHDRYDEGRQIQALLPRCPITWQKQINNFETLTSYDYSHPSYHLFKQELLRSLGHPDSSGADTVWYELGRDINHMHWDLSVNIRDDYVVGSMIFGR